LALVALAALSGFGAGFRGFDNYGIVKELIDMRADFDAKIEEEE
jgi:hypothetical protein